MLGVILSVAKDPVEVTNGENDWRFSTKEARQGFFVVALLRMTH
jgi:hypothetical protein